MTGDASIIIVRMQFNLRFALVELSAITRNIIITIANRPGIGVRAIVSAISEQKTKYLAEMSMARD